MKKSITHPGFSAVEAAEAALETSKHEVIVLLVDDQPMVAKAIEAMVAGSEDIFFHYCDEPSKALQMAAKIKPTVILQDLIMPQVDGLTMVKFFRTNPHTKEIPMIVLSSREEADIKSQAFALGANDYMVKLPEKAEVLARIRYHSNAYLNLLERNQAYDALVASQTALKTELQEAERYVKSLLPEKLDTPILRTDWIFKSSMDLGGDAFGYHWLDSDHFAIYLLDVCGHGVGAALLSVSAVNVLRAQSLPKVDFTNPASVLSGLNETFDMDTQNHMYFTFWYGVYNKNTKVLHYSSGGHPPAILIQGSSQAIHQLITPGMVIGGMPDVPFVSEKINVESTDRLYVFSDGVFELKYVNDPDPTRMLTVDEFAQELVSAPKPNLSKVASMVKYCVGIQASDKFEDDFSLVEITFR